MSFINLAKQRFSVRKYKAKKVEKEKLLQVIEAGRVAPSAVNKQPWIFIVVQEEKKLKALQSCYKRDWLQTAPAIIVACGDHNAAWRRSDGKGHVDIDLAIAIDHMTLAATDVGLGTCWICKFDVMKCAEILGIPAGIEPIAMIPVGYTDITTDADRHSTKRKPIEDIVRWEKF